MMSRIPPHIFWPGLIIGLLSISVTAGIITAVDANSGRGPQVIHNYYQRALDWDQHKALLEKSMATGWTVQVRVSHAHEEHGVRPVTVAFRDRNGRPLTGLQGRVRLDFPAYANPVGYGRLRAQAGHPGNYVVDLPVSHTGLWNFIITLHHPSSAAKPYFLTTVHEDVTL